MNPFDLNNLGGLFGGLQQKMADIKEKAASTKVTGTAGNDLVTVTLSCDYHVDAVTISPEAMDDREMLEDLVRAALAEALRQAREETANGLKEMTGGLPIPPGLIPGL